MLFVFNIICTTRWGSFVKLNPAQINFKANVEAAKLLDNSAIVTNPIQNQQPQSQGLPNVVPTYNVQTPMKYASLGKQELPYSTVANLYKLENGQRVVIIPKEGSTVVKTYVNVGSMNEPDKVRGISHFVEHSLFNGSNGLKAGEFFDTVNKIGANTNASTGFAATDYYISSHLLKKNDLEKEIKIHGSMLESPKFAVDMIEKEKGPVTSEINMILDDPNNVATNSTLKLLYNIKSDSKDIIGGTADNINKLTREDVVDYYERNYTPQNMVTVITGEVDPDATMALISKHFGSKNVNPKPRNFEKLVPIEKSVRNDIISDKTNSAVISMGFCGPKNSDSKDKILMDAFTLFLTGSSVSRLNKSLEKIQTNASMTTDRISTKPEDSTLALLSTQTSDGNTEDFIKTVFTEISKLETNPPTEQELDSVKKKLKLGMAQVFESSEMVNSAVGTGMLDNDLNGVVNYEKTINDMTSKDIVDFAKKYFDLNKVAITVVHPNTADSESITKNYKKSNQVSFTGNSDSAEDFNHKIAINTSKVKQYGITNNISVVTNETKSDMAVLDLDLSASVPADVKPGLPNVLSMMLNRGSAFSDENKFFTDLEKQGIATSFVASERGISANSTFLPADGVKAIKSAKEVLLNPRFTQDNLDYCKKVLKENIQNSPKTSSEGLLKEMFKGQFYGNNNEDALKNIDSIQLSDVKGLHQYILNNAQGHAAISAPFEKNETLKNDYLKELCSDFSTLKKSQPTVFDGFVPVQKKSVVVQEHNKSQAEIQMGYKFKSNNNLKDSVTFDLLNTILGGTPSSRLFSDLREKQKLAYQVNSKLAYFDNSGVLSLNIKTTTDNSQTGEVSYDNLQKSLNGFKSHVQKLVDEKVSEDELENAKLNLKTTILNSAESTSDKNISILGGLKSFYGVSLDNQALDIIDKITVDDIKASAGYIFGSNPTVSIVASKNTIENNKDYLKTLGTVV